VGFFVGSLRFHFFNCAMLPYAKRYLWFNREVISVLSGSLKENVRDDTGGGVSHP